MINNEDMVSDNSDFILPKSILGALEKDPILVLTQDLQSLQADFQNYRRRVDRERIEAQDVATAKLLKQLLPALDDIDRAKEHEELEGGFKAVANHLLTMASNLGLQKFNETNVSFDPNVHEAILHEKSPNVNQTEVTKVLRPGYRFKDSVIRPAQVVVSDPIG